jgi:formate dehydrogenase major subunit
MGATQHTVGTANVRALCILALATGNVGKPGTGANIFRGHTNVQGATDLGLDISTLPLYYGLVEGAWRHWARVWEVEYEWLQARFDEVPAKNGRPARTKKQNMEAPGITSTRWFDGVNLPESEIDQRAAIKALMVFGHGGNTVTRIPEAVEGMNKLELLVVADPHPTTFAALGNRKAGVYLLPYLHLARDGRLAHGLETARSSGASRIVKPRFESKKRLRGVLGSREEARLRGRECSRTSRSRNNIPVAGGRPARDQTGAAGRPAIAGNLPSASRRI